MSYNIYSVPSELTSPKIARAFHRSTGFKVYTDAIERDGGWIGFGSPQNINTYHHAAKNGFNTLYVDHAYYGRHEYYRVIKNGLYFTANGKPDFDRLARFYPKEKKWNKSGKNIIICPQSVGYFERNGINRDQWIENVKKQIRAHSDRPIIIHGKWDRRPLISMLNNAWCVVSQTSNSGLEAVMNGVPSFCTGDSHINNISYKGFDNIESPLYPENRMHWAAILANNQWTLKEIEQGKAWEALLNAKI